LPRLAAIPARTLDFTFIVFSFAHLVPCPSHVDLVSPMLAELRYLRVAGRLGSHAISDLNRVPRYDDSKSKHLLNLVHKIG